MVGIEGVERRAPHAERAVRLRGPLQLGHTGPGVHQNIQNADIRLKRAGIQPFYLHSAEDGTGDEERCGTGPVRLDGEIRRLVTLSAFDLERHAAAAGPVLGFQEVFVSFHFAADLDTEAFQYIDGNEQVRDAAGFGDIEDGFIPAEGQGGKEAADQLAALLAGNLRTAGNQGPGDLQRQGAVETSLRQGCLRIKTCAKGSHDVMGTAERTPKEGFLSGDADGRRAEDREKRNQEAGQQA